VDPGGYNPFVIRFSKGLVGSLTISRHSRNVVLPVKISGEKSGKLTKGIVKRILTKSPNHHHGIKVMLEDNQVGRVKGK